MNARAFPLRLTSAALALLAGAWCAPAAAQGVPTLTNEEIKQIIEQAWGDRNKAADNADVFTFDYDVPSSPALTLLDAGDTKVNQSNSLKPFVLSIPTVLDSKQSGQAVALDFSPAWLLQRRATRTYANYTGTTPLWFRTHIGLAVYQGISDTDPAKQRPSRLSVGVATSIFDSSDPLLAHAPSQTGSAWGKCLDGGYEAIKASMPPVNDTAETREVRRQKDAAFQDWLAIPDGDPRKAGAKSKYDQLQTDYDKLVKQWAEDANKTFAKSKGAELLAGCLRVADRAAKTGLDLDLGGGAVWEGQPGKATGFANPAAVFWSSLRIPISVGKPGGEDSESLIKWADELDSWFMIGGSGRIGVSEAVATGDSAKPKIRADTFTGWLGVERNSDTNRLTAQVGLRRTSPRLAGDKAFAGTQTVYLVGVDQKLLSGLWLNATYGWANGSGALKSDSVIKLGITLDTPGLRKIFGD